MGTTVTGLGDCAGAGVLVGGGLVIVAVAALVTWGPRLAGWGKPSGVRPRAGWGMRVRDTAARSGHPGCLGCRLAGRKAAGRKAAGRSALSVAAPTVAGDGTGMEEHRAALVGGAAGADVGRGAS
ncbi:HGxxPAAW family protein [Streptomyces antibioticus]|uniref:HGxxPAAW family protein n=1 Tax=Streptomyces antibioticus TaxID=1890 RepID=UPI0036B939B9